MAWHRGVPAGVGSDLDSGIPPYGTLPRYLFNFLKFFSILSHSRIFAKKANLTSDNCRYRNFKLDRIDAGVT
jgi:hypothetical protein